MTNKYSKTKIQNLHLFLPQIFSNYFNLLLKNGFTQEGDYCFIKNYKGNPYGSELKFFLYHFYSDGLCLNTYNPKQDFILIKNKEDMQTQINRLTDGSLA